MKEIKNTKKSKIIKVAALLGLFLFVFGISYALFTVVLNGTKRNRITTGDLKLRLTDVSGVEEKDLPEGTMGIDLENVTPMSDEEGLGTEGYTFIVENYGTTSASYTLSLDKETTSTLNEQYIKYSLDQSDYLKTASGYYKGGYYSNKEKVVEENWEGPKKLDSLVNSELDKTTLLPGEKMEYTLRLWLDYDAENDAMNKEYSAKIRVDGIQPTTAAKGKAGDTVDYTLYKDGTLAITGTGEMNNLKISSDGNTMQAKYNGLVPYDIIYQKLKEQGMKNIEKIELNGKVDLDTKFFYEVGGNNFFNIDNTYTVDDVVNDRCEGADCVDKTNFMCLLIITLAEKDYNSSDPFEGMTEEEVQQILSETERLLKAIEKDLPKVKRVVIDEGVTSLSEFQFYQFVGNGMITLPSTLTHLGKSSLEGYNGYTVIIPPKLTIIPNNFLYGSFIEEITIPNTIQKVEESGLSLGYGPYDKITIYVDNTEEFVEANWDHNWNYFSGAKVIYLR